VQTLLLALPPLAALPVVVLTCIKDLALALVAMMELAVPVQTMVVLTAWLALGVLALGVLALVVLRLLLPCHLFVLCLLLLMTPMPGRM